MHLVGKKSKNSIILHKITDFIIDVVVHVHKQFYEIDIRYYKFPLETQSGCCLYDYIYSFEYDSVY
jgi:hypothetical protein